MLSPIFTNIYDFCGYKLCEVCEDEHKITLVLERTSTIGRYRYYRIKDLEWE